MNTSNNKPKRLPRAKALFRLAVLFCALFVGVGSVSGQRYTLSTAVNSGSPSAAVECGTGYKFSYTQNAHNGSAIKIADNGNNINFSSGWTLNNTSWGDMWGAIGLIYSPSYSNNTTIWVLFDPTTSTVTFSTSEPSCPAPNTPTITARSSVTGLSTTPCEASPSQSFTVSGANLEGAVTATLSGGDFEISSDNTTWGSSVTIPASGTLSNTTVYARLKTGLSQGNNKTATITLSSSNAPNKTITLSGNVVAPNCGFEFDYNPAWCNGIPFEEVKTGGFASGAASCVYVTNIQTHKPHKNNSTLDFTINGVTKNQCDNNCSDGVTKADNGYYVYTPANDGSYSTGWSNAASLPQGRPAPCPNSLTTSSTNISDLGYAECGTPTPKTFTVGAPNPCNITATLSGGDTDAFVVTKSGGTVTVTMKSSYPAGTTKTATITVGDGSTTQTVTVSGTVGAGTLPVISNHDGSSITEAVSACELGCTAPSYQFGINKSGNGVFRVSLNGTPIQLKSNTNVTVSGGIDQPNWNDADLRIPSSGYVKLTYTPGAAKPYTLEFSTTKFPCGATLTTNKDALALTACAGTAAIGTFTVEGALLSGDVSIALSGANAGDFEVTPTSITKPASGMLSATTVTVTLKSTATAGAKTATLTVSSPTATDKTVTLTGTVNATTYTGSTSLDFGNECAFTNPKTFTIAGNCLGTVNIAAGAGFTVDKATAAVGETVTVTRTTDLSFTNETAVIISGGGLASNVTISASGTKKTPSITPSTTSVTGLGYKECATPAAKSFTFTSECTGSITASLTGGDTDAFDVSQSGNTVTVTMKPGFVESDSKTATVTVTDGTTTQDITVSGTVEAKTTPNYTAENRQNTSNVSSITECGSGCSASYKFSYTQASGAKGILTIRENGTIIDFSTWNRTNSNRLDWGDKLIENNTQYDTEQTIWVEFDPILKTITFLPAGTEPDCGPTIKADNITFDPVCPTTAYTAKTVTIKGTSLTADPITVTPQAGYTVNGSTSTVTLTATGGAVNETVTVARTAPAGTAAFAGENAFVVSGGGATDVMVKAGGTVTTPVFTSVPPLVFTKCPLTSWNTQTFTINGTCVGTVSITGSNGFTASPATAEAGDVITVTYSGSATPVTNAITLTAGTDPSKTLTIQATATALDPTLNGTSTGTLDFGETCPGVDFAALQPFRVQGTCLPTTITVSAASGFALYTDAAGTTPFSGTLNGVDAEAPAFKTLYLKRTAIADFAQATAVTITAGGVLQEIAAKAVVKTPGFAASQPSGSMDYFNEAGGPSGLATISVTSDCWNDDFTVELCGAGAENFTLVSGATLPTTGGSIQVQLNGGLELNTYTATVCITSNGVTQQVPIEGSVTLIPEVFVRKNGNWCAGDTWSTTSCGGAGGITPTNVPGKGSNVGVKVIICAPYTVNLDCDMADNTLIHSIVVQDGATLKVNDNGRLDCKIDVYGANGNITFGNTVKIDEDCNLTKEFGDLTMNKVYLLKDVNVGSGLARVAAPNGNLSITTLAPENNKAGGGTFEADNITVGTLGDADGEQHKNLEFIGNTTITQVRGASKLVGSTIRFSKGDLTFENALTLASQGGDIDIISPDSSNLTFQNNANFGTNHVDLNINIGDGNLTFGDGVSFVGNGQRDNPGMEWICGTMFFAGNMKADNSAKIHVSGDAMQIGNAKLIADNSFASWLIHGDLNTPDEICSTNNYTLKIEATASNENTIWVRGDMYANIVTGSWLRNFAQMVVKGNAYWKGVPAGAQFEVDQSNGVFIDGFLVLDGLEMYYGGSNPYGKAHVYTGKHDQADLEAHMATLNIPCMCSDPAQYKDEEFEDATTKQDNNHYISLCGGQVGRQTHLNENGVEGIGDGKNWGYGVIDTPTEGSPVMPCPESDPDCNVPMPIELISFTAKHTGTEVDINWNTLTETNNDYFTVQRSHNGRNFDALGEVQGAGTTIVPQYYNYVDYAPLAGVSYYRLKQTDIDGKYSYSHVVPVYSNTGEHKTFEVFKTTSNGITTLECVFADTTVVNRITIHSITGKLEFEKNVAPQFNPYIVELPLAPGVYLVSNVNRHGKTVVKVLVTH